MTYNTHCQSGRAHTRDTSFFLVQGFIVMTARSLAGFHRSNHDGLGKVFGQLDGMQPGRGCKHVAHLMRILYHRGHMPCALP